MKSSALPMFERLPRMLRTRRAIALAVGVAVLGAAAFALSGPGRADRPQPKSAAVQPSATVTASLPTPTTFARSIPATGTIAARDELVIGSDTGGMRIAEVPVEIGTKVSKGQLLMRADDSQLQAQLAQQEALIKQAQAELEQADANLDRAERLKDSGVYSTETFQTRRTTAAAAAAKLELALAQRRELEVKIRQARVVAPANGVITRKSATVGAVVQPGVELFRMIRDGELEWLAELPDHSLVRIAAGGKARVFLDDGRVVEATVRQIAPTIDPATRNGLVHVTLPADGMLKSGGHAKGELVVASAEALAIPESSVLMRDGYPFVFVVGADGVARRVRIETGSRQRGIVEVTAGLTPSMRVIGQGGGFVKDGDVVRVEADSIQRVAQAGRPS